MLTPNMLHIGRNNERELDGPMREPAGGGLLDKVQESYEAWYKIWNASYIQKLMYQPKWWKQERDLKEGDIVFFQKNESALAIRWTLGTSDQLVIARDGLARRAMVKYQNFNEDFKRLSDRAIRSLVKIWSVDDQNFDVDLAQLQRRLMADEQSCDLLDQLLQAGPGGGLPQPMPGTQSAATLKFNSACGICCWDSHCRVSHQDAQNTTSNAISVLLARRPVDLGHLAQLQSVLDDLGQNRCLLQEEMVLF